MSAPIARCTGLASGATVRDSQGPRAPEAPTISPTVGVNATRADSCFPPLSSEKRGLDSVPFVTAAAISTRSDFQLTCTPVSHWNALTSGTPGAVLVDPIGKLERHPRALIRSTSSADEGRASVRSEVRYWYASGYPMTGLLEL